MAADPARDADVTQAWADSMMDHLSIERIYRWDSEVAAYIIWLERKLGEARAALTDGGES